MSFPFIPHKIIRELIDEIKLLTEDLERRAMKIKEVNEEQDEL